MGTFQIRRGGEGGGQFPAELWAALSSLYEEEEGEGEGGGVEVGAEEVELLLATLSARLKPFAETKEEDDRNADDLMHVINDRIRYGAFYRCGQRDVLRQAVASLQGMLGGIEEVEEEGVAIGVPAK